MAEEKSGNKATIGSLVDQNEREVFEPKEMYASFQCHFARMFGMNGRTDKRTGCE